MQATIRKSSTLEFRWTTSRARDTYGYNVCSLFVNGDRVSRCNGGGYDMKGTALGDFIAKYFADRLCELKPEDMPEHSHWERAASPRKICRATECVVKQIEEDRELTRYPHDMEKCPECGEELDIDHRDGRTVKDGRYFYGLTFHDPNYDAGKAVIGEDCQDRTLANEPQDGVTVAEAEAKGVSFGLERLQAFYTASSKTPTARHTVPTIDGACGFSSVEQIIKAIGLRLEYVPGRRNRRDDLYILHDDRAE